jgi:peptidyl-dipeptidase A
MARPMRAKYSRYVELANKGAREIGFADVGALWRSGYDMPPRTSRRTSSACGRGQAALRRAALLTFARKLRRSEYGKEKVPDHGLIPAELLGNMWAQEWNNIFDLVVPYPREPRSTSHARSRPNTGTRRRWCARPSSFSPSLGFDPLPPRSGSARSSRVPRDREVVCHASAWDVSWSGDLRIKMCIEPTEEDFVTIHHELGHDFYFQRYFKLPILFSKGRTTAFTRPSATPWRSA